MTARAVRVIFPLAILAFILSSGCGKKDWPEPDLDYERFEWVSADAEMRRTCLVATGELTGAIDNLDAVYVELERGDCPGCPFLPDSRQGYELPSPMVQLTGNSVTINVCGLDAGSTWRWRLVGRNKYDALGEALSGVGVAKAE